MKILLVDDDTALVTVLVATFNQFGIDMVTATEGKGGLEKAKTEKPDFILLDQVLPDIQGNEVLTTLKEDLETKAIPVAILSNYSDTQLMQEALNKGAMDYILKYQIEPQDLVNKVQTLHKEAKAQAEA